MTEMKTMRDLALPFDRPIDNVLHSQGKPLAPPTSDPPQIETVSELPLAFAKEENEKVKRYNAESGHLNDIDGYVCDKCKNKGYIAYRNAGETMTIKPCECLERRKHINIVEQSNMGDLIHKDLKQFVAKEKWQLQMKQSAQDYIKQRRTTWIAYLGQSGCGKTHIASCIANDYLFNRKMRIIYANWSNLAQDIRNDEWNHIDVYDTTSHEYQVCSVPVLFIDDFLKGSEANKNDIRIAYRIINQRYIRNVTTIITSELTMDEIKKIDEAIARRIYERCDSNIMQVFKDTNKNFSFTNGE